MSGWPPGASKPVAIKVASPAEESLKLTREKCAGSRAFLTSCTVLNEPRMYVERSKAEMDVLQ